ncbi:hypothetical protein BGZ76_010636, partial [Entomortierella beljakovae]
MNIFCLVDEHLLSASFSIKIDPSETVYELKKIIKAERTPRFNDLAPDELTLWRVNVESSPDRHISLEEIKIKAEAVKLEVATKSVSEVFGSHFPKDTIHVIVQRTPPSEPQKTLGTDVKRIGNKFFGSQSKICSFLDSFVRGEINLPLTTGKVPGMPRAWRRNFVETKEIRPCLLFLGLPDPLNQVTTDSSSYASANISNMVKKTRNHVPLFGVSGCGKTRAAIELLSQHWGFYFNASGDDWGSEDMTTLQSDVLSSIDNTKKADIGARQLSNSEIARAKTQLLFLSRLLIFKYCLNVPGSSHTFTSARWVLLQTCPHVLTNNLFNNRGFDVFSLLYSELRMLRNYSAVELMHFVANELKETRVLLVERESYPTFSEFTDLLVVIDEAQILGDAHQDSFKLMGSDDTRPLLSPVLHGLWDLDPNWLLPITCGTGLSISTLHWIQSSGSDQKDFTSEFEYIDIPGWTDKSSITSYIVRLKDTLPDDSSKQALDQLLPQEAIDLLYERLKGRFRPIVIAMELIIQRQDTPSSWKAAIEDTEERLASWSMRHLKGNLCNELTRLKMKQDKHRGKFSKSIEGILGLMLYRRCMFGDSELKFDYAVPELVELAFGRIRVTEGQVSTTLDEPFVMKAAENYFSATDRYFEGRIKDLMLHSNSPPDQGRLWEHLMMSIFKETFSKSPLSQWKHNPPITEMCSMLSGDVEIVGWKEPG